MQLQLQTKLISQKKTTQQLISEFETRNKPDAITIESRKEIFR